MVDTSQIYLTDRSAAEVDDKCPQRYWWNRYEGGKGVVPASEDLALRVGRETHADLQAVSELEDDQLNDLGIQSMIDMIMAGIKEEHKSEQDKMELVYRRLGWLAAFAIYLEPSIRARYTTEAIEKEVVLDRSPLWVATTPDRVLRERSGKKSLIYWDYKSTITANSKWMASWHYKIQLHLGLAAMSEELSEKVAFAQVMGLMKGDKRGEFNRLSHPYVWCWYNTKTQQWSHEYQRGGEWQHMPVWEYPGGIIAWVRFCGEEVALAQFPFTHPVFFNELMLDRWVKRRIEREQRIKWALDACKTDVRVRSFHFPMIQDQCRPPFGDQCPYLRLCWTADGQRTALSKGDFIPRQPHHELEEVGIVK